MQRQTTRKIDTPKVLELIAEAVRYCQRAAAMGMPSNCYTKALREPVHFLWERRGGRSKFQAAQFCSPDAIGLRAGSSMVVYDHAVPFALLQRDLLAIPDVTADAVREVLRRAGPVVLITKAENQQLCEVGLGRVMPKAKDGDHLARYRAIGIEPVPNPRFVPADD